MRQPVAPTGCPSEIPEPVHVQAIEVRLAKTPLRVTASTCAANASLSSIRSMSIIVSPARSRALAVAGTGPIPMVRGDTPATAHERSTASGRRPRASARSRVVTTQTAAPSFCPDAFPAVTVASGSSRSITGRKAARRSSEVSRRGARRPIQQSSPFASRR